MPSKPKKTGFGALSKSERARISSLGGKATAKKRREAIAAALKGRKTALKAVLNKHLKEKAAAKPAKKPAKRK